MSDAAYIWKNLYFSPNLGGAAYTQAYSPEITKTFFGLVLIIMVYSTKYKNPIPLNYNIFYKIIKKRFLKQQMSTICKVC